MRARRQLTTLLGALALLCAGPLVGSALGVSSSNPVIQDCLQHPGGLTGHYTVAQLNRALQVMPTETKEYTSCPDVINRARLAALGKLPGGGGGGGSSFLPTPFLIVLIVLILVAVSVGAVAVRRRRAGGSGPPAPPGPPPPA